jgi:hypothetical protein
LFQSRPMPFQQRTNTSCYLAIPTHGFTVVLSVFWGTPPAKPLNCKSVSNRLGARIRPAWAHHFGGTPRHSCPSSVALISCSVLPCARACSRFSSSSTSLLRRVDDRFRLALSDIIKTSFFLHSQFRFPFVLIVCRHIFRQQKTLLTFGKQGYRNPMFDSLPAYLSIIQTRFGGLPAIRFG